LDNKELNFIVETVENINDFLEYDLAPISTIDDLCRDINFIVSKLNIDAKEITSSSKLEDIYTIIKLIIQLKIDSGDEINVIESNIIKHILSESDKVKVGNTEVDRFIKIEAKPEGYNFEKFFSKTISELGAELSVSYTEIYDEFKDCSLSSQQHGFLVKEYKTVINPEGQKEYEVEYFKDFSEILTYYREKAIITVNDLINKYNLDENFVKRTLKYYQIREADRNCKDYIQIEHGGEPIMEDLSRVQAFATGEEKVAAQTFWVFDRTCAKLNKVMEDDRKGNKRELVGIFPVVTTAANAMFAQSLITVDDEQVTDFESVTGTLTKDGKNDDGTEFTTGFSLRKEDLVKQFSNVSVDYDNNGIMETVS
jgi:hypothetical protein